MSEATISSVETCRRCLYTTRHPLGLTIDEDGICSGCRVHEEKDRLDWAERWKRLVEITQPYRTTSGATYDCIVPVTGANDSHFIVHLVKERLGLNPLLVVYNKFFNTELGIRNLSNLRIRFNCDMIFQNVNPRSVKKITRTTLRQFGSLYWPILAGQTVFPVQTAVRFQVPLIIWGAHQGLEQVGMFSHQHEVEMSRRYRKDHDLMAHEGEDLVSIFDTLTEEHVWQYRYPDDQELKAVGVRGIYLGNYVRWDPKAQHEQMAESHGYRGTRFARTFDTYDHVDCFNFMDLHDELKLVKHGYSKVTDHACREIRHGRITREEGLALVRTYEDQPLQHSDKVLEWLGIDDSALSFILNEHRGRHAWREEKPGLWIRLAPRATATETSTIEARLGFQAHKPVDASGRGYIIMGRGYPL